MTIPDVDLTSMTGDFVALNFEYYADTFFTTDSQGNNDPSDTASIEFRYNKDGTDYKANLLGQWNDYDEDGTCGTDLNDDGFINGTEAQVINYDEIQFTGDAAATTAPVATTTCSSTPTTLSRRARLTSRT